MTDLDRFAALEKSLYARVKEAVEATRELPSPEAANSIVQEVVSSLTSGMTLNDVKFYAELEDLAAYIRRAKHEIAEIKPKDISTSHIPHATDELDAVVGATEEATNKIMDVCDTIGAIAGNCAPEISEQLIACTTRVFEACNFQDITGQRITKVVQTLKYIDEKVGALIQALGEEIRRESIFPHREANASSEGALLNGPQLPHKAIGQDEIDRLMSGKTE